MALEKKPLATVVLKNRSRAPITLKRGRSGIEAVVETFSAVGLKLYKEDCFIAIDFDSRTVTFDLGAED